MRRDSHDFDLSQPALLVTYGNTTNKHRPLDSDLIVLGYSSTCDFTLLSPEIAPIHCVLVRVREGWKLRDCSGRPGTRVNGNIVQETLLNDGDIIQVGSFTLQAHLPRGQQPESGISPNQIHRLQQSRKRLVERALGLRQALAETRRAATEARARLAAERIEVEKQSEVFRVRQHDFERRMTRLELSERDAATDRNTFEKEYRTLQEEIKWQATAVRTFREEITRRELDLENRRAAIHSEQRRFQQEWQQRSDSPVPSAITERTRELELRARELAHYARYLKRLKSQHELAPAPQDLVGELRELIVEVKKSKRRDRRGRRETLADRQITQVHAEEAEKR